jgi:HK97 gp10 family phage protein
VAFRVVFEPGWEQHIDGDVTDLLEHLGQGIEADAKEACPVDTGRLRDSLEHEVDGDTLRVGTNVEYAAYVEEGTRHMAAEPYLRPALYRVRSL